MNTTALDRILRGPSGLGTSGLHFTPRTEVPEAPAPEPAVQAQPNVPAVPTVPVQPEASAPPSGGKPKAGDPIPASTTTRSPSPTRPGWRPSA
ncbi:hypothetical protein [Streptomyces sp. 1331.2]|uniref:hypothetical protein n=1 Tax=Streptomyces sp. 1331.2 TaxID=1938835 RepID=UPI000BC7DC14|nr:hypothetical protein [Streptomyces sp. 1331.2]SOB86256.1 hypothetical protein SAMN06272789_6566 [Streptomyces sp. 1331.2]